MEKTPWGTSFFEQTPCNKRPKLICLSVHFDLQCARCDKVVSYDEFGRISLTAKLAVSHYNFPYLSNYHFDIICGTAKLAVTVLQPNWPYHS